MTDQTPRRVYEGEVLDGAPGPTLHMPRGVPLGLGILGVAKFTAIRLVMEECERGERAKERLFDAQRAAINAGVALEAAKGQYSVIEEIRDTERQRIYAAYAREQLARRRADEDLNAFTDRAHIEKLRREAEQLEQELRVAELKAQKEGQKPAPPSTDAEKRHADFIARLSRVPNAREAAQKVKADIIAGAGGEENLSPADQDLCDILDAMVQAYVAEGDANG